MLDVYYSMEKQCLDKTVETVYSEPVEKKKYSGALLKLMTFIFAFYSIFSTNGCVNSEELKKEMKKDILNKLFLWFALNISYFYS